MLRFFSVLPVVTVLVAGCDSARHSERSSATLATPSNVISDSVPFGDASVRSHDFGSIPGNAGLKLTHRYPITNGSDRPVKLLRAVNGKPCCGDVVFEPVTLAPGASAWLEVILRVGHGDVPLSHFASVSTDHPDSPVLDFRTSAQPRPRFVLERVDESIPSVKLGEKKEISLVVRSFGLKEIAAVDLNVARFESDVPIEWNGPALETTTPQGLVERTRKAKVILKAAGEPGQRMTTIGIRDGDETIPVPPFAWQVEPVLAFEPKALLLQVAQSLVEKSITLTADDGKSFDISNVTSNLPSLKVQAERSEMSPAQSIRVIFDPKAVVEARTGKIEVTTTHPSQPVATIGVFLTRSSAANPGRDSVPNRQPAQGESR